MHASGSLGHPWDENPLVGARWIALGLALVVFMGMGILPAIFGKERFYDVAQKENKDIGFMKAIGQAASSKPMMGLVGIVFALNFCGTIAGSIAMYIVIYYVIILKLESLSKNH